MAPFLVSGRPSLLIGFVFQYIFNKCVFFVPATRLRNGDIANRWLRFRFWYAIYEYVLVLPNMAIGFIFIVLRLIVSTILYIYYTFSIDICLVPSATGIEAYDAGHASYVAVARADHRYNNPIIMVFVAKLQDELTRKRLEAAQLDDRIEDLRDRLAHVLRARRSGGRARWLQERGETAAEQRRSPSERGRRQAPGRSAELPRHAQPLHMHRSGRWPGCSADPSSRRQEGGCHEGARGGQHGDDESMRRVQSSETPSSSL